MKKNPYLPKGDAARLTWLKNLNTKLINTYAALLGITAAQLLILLNDVNACNYIMECVKTAKTLSKSCGSIKKSLSLGANGTAVIAFPVFVGPGGAPLVTVPSGIFARATDLVDKIKINDAYTVAMGIDLDIIGSDIVINWLTAQPTKVKVQLSAGVVYGSFLKWESDGGRVECMRGTETVFTTFTNVTGAKFIDDRPNLIPGKPETRQYRIWYLLKDVVVGVVSAVVTITIEA